ncbi:corticoliberin [Gastrophryne carolinensis]
MKFQVLVSLGVLLMSFLPGHDCRAFSKLPVSSSGAPSPLLPQYQPLLLRMGEEYFLRLGNLHKYPPGSPAADAPSSGNFLRPGQLQQWGGRPFLRSGIEDGADTPYTTLDEPTEKGKRSEEPPISLDLTFHLLREVLEMAKAERIAQQANSNRKLMDIIGK